MAAEDIPEEVRRFVVEHIQTLEQIEVLLLVCALPDREWTVDSVFHVVQTNPEIVHRRLEEFVQSGMMVRTPEGKYRYAPANELLARRIASTSELYKLRRHKLIELIYSPRDEDLRKFSDAFRFKKDENG